jgi:hypothetical protein
MQQLVLPPWAQKAQSLSLIAEEKQIESMDAAIDSEFHEYLEDDTHFSSMFTVHDKSQCIDRTQAGQDWTKFIEEQDTSANTITGSDLPEWIEERKDYIRAVSRKNPNETALSKLSNNVLLHLIYAGDTAAEKVYNSRNLARKLDCEIIFEYASILENGKIEIHNGHAGTQEAAYYRSCLKA